MDRQSNAGSFRSGLGVKLVVFDVGWRADGRQAALPVPTAARIKAFNTLDGRGLKMLHASGVRAGHRTGRNAAGGLAPRIWGLLFQVACPTN